MSVLHSNLNTVLGPDRVGVGIRYRELSGYFTRTLPRLEQSLKSNPADVPGVPLAVTTYLNIAPGVTYLTFGKGIEPRLTYEFVWAIHAKGDQSKVFREWKFAGVDQQLEVECNRKRIGYLRSPKFKDPVGQPVQLQPDQQLIDDLYGGDLQRYLTQETSILFAVMEFLDQFVMQIPFPELLAALGSFTLGAPRELLFEQDFLVIHSEEVQFKAPTCPAGGPSLQSFTFEPAGDWKTHVDQIERGQSRQAPPSEASFEAVPHHAPPTGLSVDDVEPVTFLYLGKKKSFDIQAGDPLTKIVYHEGGEDYGFFVSWFYDATGGIASGHINLDAAAQSITGKLALKGGFGAAAAVGVACFKPVSGWVRGKIGGDADFGIGVKFDPASGQLNLHGQLTISNIKVDTHVYVFPMDLIDVELTGALMGVGSITIAKGIDLFRVPLWDLGRALERGSTSRWDAGTHVLADSYLVVLGNRKGFSTNAE